MSYEKVKLEKCPYCANNTFKNNFYLQEGKHARVFVECAKCGKLVARYILHTYVDPHYDMSSTLKMLHKSSSYGDSINIIKDDLSLHQERAQMQFDEIKRKLKENQKTDSKKEKKIMDIIKYKGIVEDG